MRIDRGTQVGFTLVEVLVVIVLVSMISALLLQMMTLSFRSFDQVTRIANESNVLRMRNQWFRNSISHLVASLDEQFGLVGDASTISGYSSAPLLDHSGKLTRVYWEVRRSGADSELWYREHAGSPMLIGKWAGGELKFSYRGLQSAWLDKWPTEELPVGVLPYRVKLSIEQDGEVRDLLAAVSIRRTGRYDYRDYFE